MKYVMMPIRAFLGAMIALLDRLFTPKGLLRSSDAQHRVDAQTAGLVLYQFQNCPFCVKVRRGFKRMSLHVELRDTKASAVFQRELLEGGRSPKVPCLRIAKEDGTFQWMYESSDILAYLGERFGEPVG
jgi:glutaredoxin